MIFLLQQLMVVGLVQAAPSVSSPKDISLILKMPRELALQSVRGSSNELLAQLEDIAFNKNQSMEARWKAFMIVTGSLKQQALPTIEKALSSSTWFMRSAALVALSQIDRAKSRISAKKILATDPALIVRSKAFEILKNDSTVSHRSLFWKQIFHKKNFLSRKSLWIRSDIARHLSLKPKMTELRFWRKLLYDSDQNLQLIATGALSKLVPGTSKQSTNLSFWQNKFAKVR